MDLSAIDGLIGRSVKSSAAEDMGRIVDLLVTPAGQIRAAVIDFGGILGVGSRKVVVDWKALSFANITRTGTVDLALSRNEVRVAPEYKSGDPIVILEAPKATKTTPSEAKTTKNATEPPATSAPPGGQ